MCSLEPVSNVPLNLSLTTIAVPTRSPAPYSLHSPSVPDSNNAPTLLGVGGALLFVNVILLVARFWSRLKPVRCLQWDDWCAFIATLLSTAIYILNIMAAAHGLGHPRQYVAFADRMDASRYLFISQVLWYFSILFIKLSVACLLVRVKRDSAWRIFLLSIIAILVISVLGQTFNQFFQCRPFMIFWDPRLAHEVKCWSKSIINANIIAFSVLQVITDLIFSCIPVTFIWTLNRPRAEKIFMCILMALGIFASIASILRTLELQQFYKSKDIFQLNTTIATWAFVEQQLGLFAATIPTLKAFIERALTRIGLFFYDANTETEVRSKLVNMGFLTADFQPEGKGKGNGRAESGPGGIEGLEKIPWIKEEDAKFYM